MKSESHALLFLACLTCSLRATDYYFPGNVGLGYGTVIDSQTSSINIGDANSISMDSGTGHGNITIGNDNFISGTGYLQYSILLGSYNSANTSHAWALGEGNFAQTRTVTLGTYAATVANASLIVGTGTDYNVRSNGLVVLKNGTVNIPSGNLQLGSQPALTSASATSAGFLTNTTAASAGFLKSATAASAGFLTSSTASSAGFLTNTTATTAGYLKKIGAGASGDSNALLSMGSSAYAGSSSVAIGNQANAQSGNNLALGTAAQALGNYSVALQGGLAYGSGSLAALGAGAYTDQAIAVGGSDGVSNGYYAGSNSVFGTGGVSIGGLWNSVEGAYSYAMGREAYVHGTDGYAHGVGVAAGAYGTVFGSRNKSEYLNNHQNGYTDWIEDSPLFEVGNGEPGDEYFPSSYNSLADTSNALTMLKNGQTTLTNKEWKANPGNPLEDPASTTDSGGEALVVEGHTRLKGKVIIEVAQGDISMGNYQ